MSLPGIHVIVINWNGLEHLEECFAGLTASGYPAARFILLDNGGDDGSDAFVRERFGHDPRVEVMRLEHNAGWSGANNIALRRTLESGAAYALLLNNDTAPEPDFVENLVAMAEAHPNVGALAPKMLLHSHPFLLNSLGVEMSAAGCAWDRGIGRLDGPRWDDARPVAAVCGGAFFLRCEALKRTGLLPESFGMYYDDVDLSLRLWEAGYDIMTCPGARVRHKFGATMKRMPDEKYRLSARNRLWLAARHFPMDKAFIWGPALVRAEAKATGSAILDGSIPRFMAHPRAWASLLMAALETRRFRAEQRAKGCDASRFWPLVRQDALFFPGTPLPAEGWYDPIMWHGVEIIPMSQEACFIAHGRRLRVHAFNCYPDTGAVCVDIERDGVIPRRIETLTEAVIELDQTTGPVTFRARRIFAAEDTGLPMDTGGWLAIEESP